MSTIYGTLSGANDYHSERGNTTWTGDDADKNIALLRGSEYIDAAYRSSFPGYPTDGRAQEREWPRSWAADIDGYDIPSDEVPVEVEQATYEAALRELVSPGSLMPDYDPASQNKREKVDVIEIEKSAPHGPSSVTPFINIIRGILAPVLTGSVNSTISGQTARI